VEARLLREGWTLTGSGGDPLEQANWHDGAVGQLRWGLNSVLRAQDIVIKRQCSVWETLPPGGGDGAGTIEGNMRLSSGLRGPKMGGNYAGKTRENAWKCDHA